MLVWRSRWAAVGAAAAIMLGAGGIGLVNAGVDSGERPVTITITPTRVLDTRSDLGLAGPFADATPRDLQLTGVIPVAPSGTATLVPADADGVFVNVTVVDPGSGGFLALRPGGATGEPTTSTVNFTAGSVVPNAATVDLGPGGAIQVYVRIYPPGGTAHVLVDVVGYTVDHTHDDRYLPNGDIQMVQGVTDWVQDDIIDRPLSFNRYPGGLRMEPREIIGSLRKSGQAMMSLTGPASIGTGSANVEYVPTLVNYCVHVWSGTSRVDSVTVLSEGLGATGSVIDGTDRTNTDLACYDIDLSGTTFTGSSYMIVVKAAGTEAISLYTVTTTWSPLPL